MMRIGSKPVREIEGTYHAEGIVWRYITNGDALVAIPWAEGTDLGGLDSVAEKMPRWMAIPTGIPSPSVTLAGLRIGFGAPRHVQPDMHGNSITPKARHVNVGEIQFDANLLANALRVATTEASQLTLRENSFVHIWIRDMTLYVRCENEFFFTAGRCDGVPSGLPIIYPFVAGDVPS